MDRSAAARPGPVPDGSIPDPHGGIANVYTSRLSILEEDGAQRYDRLRAHGDAWGDPGKCANPSAILHRDLLDHQAHRGIGSFQKASVYDDLSAPFAGVTTFDAIVSVEVVEHLYSPRIFVRRAFDALRPGGLLIVTTPYWGYLKNLALALTNRMDSSLTALWDGGHIKHWSRETLSTLLTEQPFEVVGFDGAGRSIPYLWNGMIMVARRPDVLQQPDGR